MKKLLSYMVLTIFMITISFSAIECGKFNDSSNVKVDDNTQPVTLKIVWWGNDQRKALTEKAIEMFQKDHPNVKFETKNYASTADVKTNLSMNTADEDMPDIMQMDLGFIHNFAQRDLLESFNPYMEQNILNLSDVDKSCLEGGKDNNQLYGIPLGINAYCIFVNSTVFEKAGVDIPKSGYTYEDLYQTAKKLKSQIKDADFYPLANFIDFNTYVRAMGSTYFSKDGKALGYENDKICQEYFNTMKKWMDEGLISPNSITDKNKLFTSQKSAFLYGVSNNVSTVVKGKDSAVQIISVPSDTAGKITSCVRASMFFSVSAYSKHKKEAVEFINFFINNLEVNDILMGNRGVPISSKVSDSIEKKLNQVDKQQYSFMKYIKENPSQVEPNTPNASGHVASLHLRLSEEVLNGKRTPEDAAKEFRIEANKILSGVKGE